MNTTALIVHWSMEGTMRDLLQGRHRNDEEAAPAPGLEPPDEPPVEPDYVLVKRPGDDEWQPLVTDD